MVFIYLFVFIFYLFIYFFDTGSYYVALAALELNCVAQASASQVLGLKACPVIAQLFYL